GYGVGNGHGGVSFGVFCCLVTPLYHGETPRPRKIAKKMPDKGNRFTRHHNFASCSPVIKLNNERKI
ncbi:MAG: hypothetical protein OXC72_05525, partial [Roseovarius sp.]|nr:hypothetical protein [Roseovarius sp.]